MDNTSSHAETSLGVRHKLKLLCQKQPDNDFVMAIAFHPDGRTFGSCCQSKKKAIESVSQMLRQEANLEKFSFEEINDPKLLKFDCPF